MPSNRKSAFFKAVGEAQQGEGEQKNGETVEPFNTSPVPPLDRETVKRLDLPTVEQSQSGKGIRTGSRLLHRDAIEPSHSETVKPSHRSTVRTELQKTSFYLSQEQLDRLDELAYAYKRQVGKRINRNDIIRFLVEHARLETLLAEW